MTFAIKLFSNIVFFNHLGSHSLRFILFIHTYNQHSIAKEKNGVNKCVAKMPFKGEGGWGGGEGGVK